MKSAASILVTGSSGQLGSEFKDLEKDYSPFRFFFTDRNDLSITDQESIDHFFETERPDWVINCAAYTAVDKAEVEKDTAMAVNAAGVGHLSAACARYNAKLIHISTDYVYDESIGRPLKESDRTHPLSVYGQSKLAGEQLALEHYPSSMIIRTSWLYSTHGKNFVKTMIRLMQEKESLRVVYDQVGSPTYAADLAGAIMQIISSKNPKAGIYNYSNHGAISWYDFASEIKLAIQSECAVYPIPTSEYPTPASRPKYSVLDTTKIRETFNVEVLPWKDSLKTCIARLQEESLDRS